MQSLRAAARIHSIGAGGALFSETLRQSFGSLIQNKIVDAILARNWRRAGSSRAAAATAAAPPIIRRASELPAPAPGITFLIFVVSLLLARLLARELNYIIRVYDREPD